MNGWQKKSPEEKKYKRNMWGFLKLRNNNKQSSPEKRKGQCVTSEIKEPVREVKTKRRKVQFDQIEE